MAIGKWNLFGQPIQSVPDNSIPQPSPISGPDRKHFGLENFGNTCYANSVLQALYFCSPFRDLVIQHGDPPCPPSNQQDTLKPIGVTNTPIPSSSPTLISALRSLYIRISQNPADKGTIAPRAFIEKLKELNESFRNTMHQDAHEFLNYLLNKIVEEIEQEKKLDDSAHSVKSSSTASQPLVMTSSTFSSAIPSTPTTFVHQIFEGILTSETRCLTCENVSSRDESFLDLSIDIEQNSSVTACLRQFSASEMLCQKNKFFCDGCCDLQEAEKRLKIKRLPNVLALHLKRFKYQEDVQKYIKLAYRVAFPFELRLFDTIDDAENPDRLYELFAIVVHIGSGPNHGHYISIIKTMGTWLIFDDETVDTIKESDIPKYFGESHAGSAYVLYYQAVDLDLSALNLRPTSSHVPEDRSHQSFPTNSPASVSQHFPTDSPASISQPILPPGLSAELADAGVAETVPLTPPSLPMEIPTLPAERSPRKISYELIKSSSPPVFSYPATVGRGSSPKLSSPTRNGILKHVSSKIGADKHETHPKQSSTTPFPRTESLPPPPPVLALASLNGKGKETETKSSNWFRKKSLKSGGKPALLPSLDNWAGKRLISPDVPSEMRASPMWFHANGSTPKHSEDGSLSESAGLGRPVAPFIVHHRLASASSLARISSQSASTGQDASPSISISDTASYSSHTTSISGLTFPLDHYSQTLCPLPSIPASPQWSQTEPSLPSAYPQGSSAHSRPLKRHAASTGDFEPQTSPKAPALLTPAGAFLSSSSSASSPRDGLPSVPGTIMHDPLGSNTPMLSRLDTGKTPAKTGASLVRPKSVHATTTFGSTLQASALPNVGLVKRANRKMSFTASFPFRKDKQREKEKE